MPSNNHHSGYPNELIAPESQAAEISRFEQEILKLDPFRTLPTFEQDREMYEDLGSVGEFKVEVGEGECAK